jgi:hypothetical protein
MTREDGERALLEFAGFMKEATVYVVGSQAIYGSFPDLDLGIVRASKDIDGLHIENTRSSRGPGLHAKLGSLTFAKIADVMSEYFPREARSEQ